MPHLLKLIWDICCLRRGPQDLPYAPALLVAVCALSLGMQQAAAWLLGLEHETFGAAVLSLLVNLGALLLLLALRNLRSRFVQAATALLSCAMVFFVISIPLTLMFGTPPQNPGTAAPLQVLAALLSLPLLVWKLMVDANVLRHSLNMPFLAGIALAVLWLIVELAISNASGGAAPSAA